MAAEPLRSARFSIRGMLGRGGMGVVYEAHDRETDSVVALKVLRRVQGESLLRFKKEFRSLSDIEHPNLVRLGELVCEDGRWMFTMELVRGQKLLDHVRGVEPRTDVRPRSRPDIPQDQEEDHSGPGAEATAMDTHSMMTVTATTRPRSAAPEHPLSSWLFPEAPPSPPDAAPLPWCAFRDEARLRAALGQLALAIEALHRLGRVHRDIKPSNVLVESTGRVVLLDFGLVAELGHDERAEDDDEAFLGTPIFMAPEQAESARVGTAADWYAFGVILFMALTGSPPFDGPSDLVIRLKRSREAPSPSSLSPGIPADLEALCARLLRRDPAERPTGGEVLAALGVAEREVSPGSIASLPPSRMLFVGRDHELAALRDVLDDVRRGRGRAALVHGEPGVGKSALMSHFLTSIAHEEPRVVILEGRCYEQESLPFRAFDAIIDALTHHLKALAPAELEPLLRGGVQALATVFPVLRRVPGVAALVADSAPPGRGELRARAFDELTALLAALAERGLLVLFIDDIQWADHESLALLAHLLTSPDAPPCALIAAMRGAAGQLPDLGALGAGAARFTCIGLGGLSEEQSEALVTALVGGDARESARVRAAPIHQAAGHPLFLTELVRWGRSAPVEQLATAKLEDVLWRRIEGLDPAARCVMELAALIGVPVPYRAVVEAAGLDGEAAQRALSTLRAAQLLRVTHRGDVRLVEPYHDRVREAIRERAPAPADPAAVHLAVGRSLLAHTPEDELDSAVFAIVRHLGLGAARMSDAAARARLSELCLRAGRKARLSTAYAMAAGYIDQGIGHLSALHGAQAWDDAGDLLRALFVERMEIEYLSGDVEAGRARFAMLLARARGASEASDLHVIRVRLETNLGSFGEALEAGRAGLRRLGIHLPARAGQVAVLREYLAVRWHQGRRPISALSALPDLADERIRSAMKLLMALTPAAFFVDTIFLTVVLMRIAGLSLAHGVADVSAYAFAAYGGVLAGAFHRYHGASALGELAGKLCERFGNRDLLCKVHFLRGSYLTPWARPFSEAKAQLERGCELGRLYGDTEYEAFSAGTLAVIDLCEGRELGAMQERAESCAAIARRRQSRDMAGMVECLSRLYTALRGAGGAGPREVELDVADIEAAARREGLSDERTPCAMFYRFLAHAELCYLMGEHRRALACLRPMQARIHAIFGVPITAELWLLRALIAAAVHSTSRSWLERRRLRRLIRASAARLRDCASSCPDNFEAHSWLAAAEGARVAGRACVALERYRLAERAAARSGAVGRQAIALELSARLARASGGAAAARAAEEAVAAYRRWGAHVKAAQLAGELLA